MAKEKFDTPKPHVNFGTRFMALTVTAGFILMTSLASLAQNNKIWDKVQIVDDFNFGKRKTLSVGSRDEFVNALSTVKPGEVILLRNGTYTDWGTITIGVSGSKHNRIVIAAGNPGGVVFRGDLRININADNTTVYGLSFVEVNKVPDPGSIISIYGNNIRISGCTFVSSVGPVEDHAYQIVSTGDSSRVDHCYFHDMLSRGIKIRYRDEMYWKGSRGNYLIDHNILRDMRYARTKTIQGESIYTGSGAEELAVLQTGVITEYNLFHYAEGDKHGEIVSDKSSTNIYRYNMFAYGNCYLSLRHGTSKLVYGNVFYNLPLGLSAINKNHLVCNNYFLNCGTAIRIYTGNESQIIPMVSTAWSCCGSPYGNTTNCVFTHNTIIGCENGLAYVERGPFPVEKNTVVNNIFSGISGVVISASIDTGTNTIDNNLFNQYGTIGSGGSNTIMQDPLLNNDRLPLLSKTSPARNSAKKNMAFPEGLYGNAKGGGTPEMNMGVLASGLYGFDYKKIPYFPEDLDAIKGKPLQAVIQIIPDDLEQYQPVIIDGGASCGNITEYRWDLGNGVVVKSKESVITVLWKGDSKQSVKLTVVDGSGKTNSTAVTISKAAVNTSWKP